jgi:undecaprenyl-diphosphatase
LTDRRSSDKIAAFAVVTSALLSNFVAPVALANPLAGTDREIALWFHERLTPASVRALELLSDFGSALWVGVVLFVVVLFCAWKRRWIALAILIAAVPGGMLLNEWMKILVHRPRPFVRGPFVDWSGYSFASGHAIGATLLYGQLLLFVLPSLKTRHWRLLCILGGVTLVVLVGFSRVALGAHFLSDVLGAIVLGVVWLVLCARVGSLIRRHHEPSPDGEDVG